MREHFNKSLISNFLICCLSVLPWYLFAKFILKLAYNVNFFAGVVFVIFYLLLSAISILRNNALEEKEFERKSSKFLKNYGKGFVFIVSIQFFIIVLIVVILMLGRG